MNPGNPTDREQERAAVVAYLSKGNPYVLRDPGLYIRLQYAWAAFRSPMTLMASGVIVAAEEIERGDHLTDRPAP